MLHPRWRNRAIIPLCSLILWLMSFSTYSQNRETLTNENAERIVKNARQVTVDEQSDPRFVRFKEGTSFSSLSSFESSFNLPAESDLVFKTESKDNLGFTHLRYVQTFKGIEILGAQYIFHLKGQMAMSANGNVYHDITLNSTPTVSPKEALQIALNEIGADAYMWENEENEQFIKRESKDPEATFHPKGALFISNSNYDKSAPLKLVYQFDIYASSPIGRYNVEVDAHSGEIVNSFNRIHNTTIPGTGESLYNGTVNINVDHDGTAYYLSEDSRGNGIHTYDMGNGTNYANATLFTEGDNHFDETNSHAGVGAHYGAAATYDYFLNNFGRNSYDNAGASINSYVHYSSGYFNAFWDGSRMTYGDGNGVSTTALVSLDIVGHEITHAVTERSAGLIYRNESGALNESFSDIFGQSVEFEAAPSTASWYLGNEVYTDGVSRIRSMQDPNSSGDPDTYLGSFWFTGSGDNGGVHTNSGVQNFWYYLLVEGGNGTNDNGYVYSVPGIGLADAQQIAYRNLTVYLNPSSGYLEARQGAEQSAMDLFGAGSTQYNAVVEAWNAVGVPSAEPQLSLPTALDFGNVPVGLTEGIDVNIANTGTGTLNILNITTNNDAFDVFDSAFSVSEATSVTVEFTFTPSVLGDTSAVVSVFTNVDTTQIMLSGAGVEPPVVSVTPSSLSADLFTGESTVKTLTIDNTAGASDLDWVLQFELPDSVLGGAAQSIASSDIQYMNVVKGERDPRIGPEVTSASGGPDNSGYAWIDSDQPNGPDFLWEDISATGINFIGMLEDDNVTDGLPIGFDFEYYGNSYTEFYVGSNGFIGFDANLSDGCCSGQPVPNEDFLNNIISWAWRDGLPTGSAYYENFPGKTIIQFEDHGLYDEDGAITAQIILYANGDIKINYLSLTGGYLDGRHSVGIENQDGSDGLQVAFNTPYLHDNLSVLFYHPLGWVSASEAFGTIPAGETRNVDIGFDATSLFGGTYSVIAEISSNDPINQLIEVPIVMNVTGSPNIDVLQDTVNFGSVPSGGTETASLRIRNTGTFELIISDIQASNASFILDTTYFEILPSTEAELFITYEPTVVGLDDALLTIFSNDSDDGALNINLFGEAVEPPSIVIAPDSLSENLRTGETSLQVMTIDNSAGTGELSWSLEIAEPNPTVSSILDLAEEPVMAYMRIGKGETDPRIGPAVMQSSGGPDNFGYTWRDSDDENGPEFVWDNISSIGVNIINDLDDDIVAGPYPIGFNFKFYENEYSEFYVSSNGFIWFDNGSGGSDGCCSGQPIPLDDDVNNMIAWAWRDGFPRGNVYYNNFEDRTVIQFVGYGVYSDLGNISAQVILYNTGEIKLNYLTLSGAYEDGSQSVGIENTDGTDGLQVAFDTYYLHDELSILFKRTVSWIDPSQTAGVLPPGESQNIEMLFDAFGLAGGTYNADITVKSNDPNNSEVVIPVTLDVTAAPDITLVTPSIDFGMVYEDVEASANLVIVNEGAAQLMVSDVMVDNTDFSVGLTSFEVAPGESYELTIDYLPMDIELDNTTLTFLTNDFDEDSISVSILAEGVGRPVIAVSPDSISQTMFTRETSTRLINIDNSSGQGDLIVNVILEATADVSTSTINRLPLTNGHNTQNNSEEENILIIQDSQASGVLVASFIQDNYGKSSTVIRSSNLAETDLEPYDLIITAGGQNNFYYANIGTNRLKLENYVRNGGTLMLNASGTFDFAAVGGVIVDWPGIQSFNFVTDRSHPIVQGLPSSFSNSAFRQSISTTKLTNLPADARIIARGNTNTAVTLAEYSIGFGTVLASGMALENAYANSNNSSNRLLGRCFEYCLSKITQGGISLSIANDTIPAGESRDLEVVFDAQDIAPGFYETNIKIESNDPFNGLVTIPVDLTVLRVIDDLSLEAVCSDNPDAERNWLVTNPNDFEVDAFWFIVGSDQYDSITFQPGVNEFSLSTLPDRSNMLKIRWLDELSVQQEAAAESTDRPCRIRGLILNSVCSDNPDLFRRWEVVNPSLFDVNVEWELEGTNLAGSLSAAPGNSYFFTEAIDGDNYVKITWMDEDGRSRRQRKVSLARPCSMRGLILNAVCSENDSLRRWEIVNRNAFSTPVDWALVGTSFTGSVRALPGSTYFTTNTVEGDNAVRITWWDKDGNPKRQQHIASNEICTNSEFATINTTAESSTEQEEGVSKQLIEAVTFPNPFDDRISVRLRVDKASEGDYVIQIHNILGVMVYKRSVQTYLGELNTEINATDFANGTYIMTVVSLESGWKEVTRLVKK